jgi:hypothetical protein
MVRRALQGRKPGRPGKKSNALFVGDAERPEEVLHRRGASASLPLGAVSLFEICERGVVEMPLPLYAKRMIKTPFPNDQMANFHYFALFELENVCPQGT